MLPHVKELRARRVEPSQNMIANGGMQSTFVLRVVCRLRPKQNRTPRTPRLDIGSLMKHRTIAEQQNRAGRGVLDGAPQTACGNALKGWTRAGRNTRQKY